MSWKTDYKGYVVVVLLFLVVVVVVVMRLRSRITQLARYFKRLLTPPTKRDLLKADVRERERERETEGLRYIFGGRQPIDRHALVIRLLGTLPGLASVFMR